MPATLQQHWQQQNMPVQFWPGAASAQSQLWTVARGGRTRGRVLGVSSLRPAAAEP